MTIAVCAILMWVVFSPVVTGRPLREEAVDLMGDLLVGCLAIISLYVGSQLRNNKDK